MRMFWGCTHVTLRETELPLLLDTGVEVVPEEPNESVLTAQEFTTYECPQEHEINRLWRERCSIDKTDLGIIRRANLVRRRGAISELEQRLFNRWIDVVYIATNLETACRVKSWFNGTVVFRHFGTYDFLGDFREQVKNAPKHLLCKLVLCPIFDSIATLPESQCFADTIVVHGVRSAISNLNWQGFENTQNYAVVAHNVCEGTEAANAVDQLAPFARRNLTWLYGKNDIAGVPPLLQSAFLVTGYQDRIAYYENLSSRRLLLHPFNNPYHNHYTNIEAVAASIPVLIMSENPLSRENGCHELPDADQGSLGICKSIEKMTEFAEDLYDNKQALDELIAKQKWLLKPFSNSTVRSEIENLISALRRRLGDKAPALQTEQPEPEWPSFLTTGFEEAITMRRQFVDEGGLLPADLFIDFMSENSGKPAIHPGAVMPALSFGPPRQCYQPGNHTFAFDFEGAGHIGLCIEVWQDGSRKNRQDFSGRVDGPVELTCSLTLEEPVQLLFFFGAVGSTPIVIHEIRHTNGTAPKGRDGKVSTALSLWGNGKNVKTVFSPFGPLGTELEQFSKQGLELAVEEAQQFILPAVNCPPQRDLTLKATVFSDNPADVTVTMECWVDDAISVAQQKVAAVGPGKSEIVLDVPQPPNQTTPVIYVNSQTDRVCLQSIEILNAEFVGPSSTSSVESPPVFYGQFSPPVDQFLYENFFQDFTEQGVYVECGACDGVADSSCLFFHRHLNWTGINIEPTPYFFQKLEVNRSGDRNLNIALSNTNGTAVFKHAIHPFWGRHFGNGSLTHKGGHLVELEEIGCVFEDYTVEVRRFRDILAAENLKRFDLMVLDVEGHEMQVLEDILDWPIQPRVLCVEFPQTGLDNLRQLLENAGYQFFGVSHSNAFWTKLDLRK